MEFFFHFTDRSCCLSQQSESWASFISMCSAAPCPQPTSLLQYITEVWQKQHEVSSLSECPDCLFNFWWNHTRVTPRPVLCLGADNKPNTHTCKSFSKAQKVALANNHLSTTGCHQLKNLMSACTGMEWQLSVHVRVRERQEVAEKDRM